MKKVYPLILMFYYLNTNAQPVISSNNCMANGTYYSVQMDYTGHETTISTVGANQQWHLEYMVPVQPVMVDTVDVIAASATPYTDSFSTATHAVHSHLNNDYNYYSVSSSPSQIDWIGMHDSAQGIITMSNPKTILQFPFAYSVTNTDNYAYHFLDASVPYDVWQTGSISSHNGGYGSLYLPNGLVINDAIYISTVTYGTDTYNGGSRTITFTDVDWYSPSYSYKLVHFEQVEIDGFLNSNSLYYNGTTVSVGIDKVVAGDKRIIVYPNPATSELFIKTNHSTVSEINIYNTTGSLVSQSKLPQSQSINISQLPIGIYVAEIKTKDATVKKRWVKM